MIGLEKVAERQGFEPWKDLHPCRFSRPVHSTTLPSLRQDEYTLPIKVLIKSSILFRITKKILNIRKRQHDTHLKKENIIKNLQFQHMILSY